MVEDLKIKVQEIDIEYAKFVKGNKAAGSRTRKMLQEVKKIAQELRIAILDAVKNAAPAPEAPKADDATFTPGA